MTHYEQVKVVGLEELTPIMRGMKDWFETKRYGSGGEYELVNFLAERLVSTLTIGRSYVDESSQSLEQAKDVWVAAFGLDPNDLTSLLHKCGCPWYLATRFADYSLDVIRFMAKEGGCSIPELKDSVGEMILNAIPDDYETQWHLVAEHELWSMFSEPDDPERSEGIARATLYDLAQEVFVKICDFIMDQAGEGVISVEPSYRAINV